MRPRWMTILLAAVGFVFAVLVLMLGSKRAAVDGAVVPRRVASSAPAEHETTPEMTRANVADVTPPDVSDGSASGAIHFERAAPGSRIDMNVRAAVGIWQPGAHRLRVLLLERAPTPQQSASLAASLQ